MNNFLYGEGVLMFIFLIIVSALVLPRVEDSIRFRAEMIGVVLLCVAGIIIFGVIRLVPFLNYTEKNVIPLYQILFTPIAIAICMMQTTYPVYLSYRAARLVNSEQQRMPLAASSQNNSFAAKSDDEVETTTLPPASKLTLEDILSDRKLLARFREFLQVPIVIISKSVLFFLFFFFIPDNILTTSLLSRPMNAQSEYAQESLFYLIEVSDCISFLFFRLFFF
jgi:hypothetical protein